jgi:F0F1-type ATP synthase assembly protein I
MMQENRGDADNKSLSGNDFAGVGIQFAITLVLFVFLGSWLDKRFETGPLFVVLGLFVGGGGGFYSLYRKVAAAQKADDEIRRKKREEGR